MRNKIAIMGWVLDSLLVIGIGVFMYQVYPREEGYSLETRARMDELVANVTPLSVADLGIDAEEFMQ